MRRRRAGGYVDALTALGEEVRETDRRHLRRPYEVTPTWDSRNEAEPYTLTMWVGERLTDGRQSLPDPFVSHRVTVGWLDVLRCAVRWRRLKVETVLGARQGLVEDVLELDANYRGVAGSKRRENADAELRVAIVRHVDGSGA